MMDAHTCRGHLFGHYDSRGGTTFIEADSKDEALRHYPLAFGYEPGEKTQFDLPAEDWLAALDTEDYLGPATLTSDELLEVGQDLDGGFTGEYDEDTIFDAVAVEGTMWLGGPFW